MSFILYFLEASAKILSPAVVNGCSTIFAITLKGIVGDVLDSNDYVKVITSTFDDLNDMYSIEYKV